MSQRRYRHPRCVSCARMSWWRDGVLYQIYPRSFGDANGDGIGDLRGIVDRLDHLEWLGIDGIWLNPTMPSPNEDWGYDVADYCAVHPDLGTLDDLDALVAEAGRRGIRVLLDLVPNHTSDRHAWFVDALAGGRHRDFYVWADPAPGGGPPNNWLSNFGGSGMDARRALGPVLPAQLPARPAGPELVERRRPRGVRRRAAVLVRARGRGLPDRRLPRDRQGPRAARRSGRHARRPPEGARARHPPGVLDEPPRGARRPEALAPCVGTRPGPGGGDVRARRRPARPVLRHRRGPAAPGVQLPVRARRRWTRPSCGRWSRRSRRSCRPAPGRCGPAPTTTRAGSRRAGRAATRRRRAWRC